MKYYVTTFFWEKSLYYFTSFFWEKSLHKLTKHYKLIFHQPGQVYTSSVHWVTGDLNQPSAQQQWSRRWVQCKWIHPQEVSWAYMAHIATKNHRLNREIMICIYIYIYLFFFYICTHIHTQFDPCSIVLVQLPGGVHPIFRHTHTHRCTHTHRFHENSAGSCCCCACFPSGRTNWHCNPGEDARAGEW